MGGDQSSAWQLLPDLDGGVWTQTIGIRERGRISLPPAARERLPWTAHGGTYLTVLGGDGAVRVIDWKTNGDRIGKALKERYAALPPDQRADFALAAMDRYQKVRGEKGGRITLPTIIRTQIDPDSRNFVRIVVRDGSLYLWDDEVWKAGRSDRIAQLERMGIM